MKILYVVFICVLCSCAKGDELDNKINVCAAMNSLGKISAQTISSDVKYVVLETNDSTLVGQMPDVCVLDHFILVSSVNQCLKLFDRFTGKFIRDIGHVGADPHGYAKDSWGKVNYWVDYDQNIIYILGWANDLISYDLSGNYKDRIGIENNIRYNLQQSYLCIGHGKLWGHNKLYTSNQTSPLFCIDKDSNHIKDITGLPVDLLPMDDLQSVSELLGDYASYGGDLTMASFTNGGKYYTAINSPSLWRFGDDIRLKQAFNDTIYTLSDNGIGPYLIFELGDWHWRYQDRLEEDGCEKKMMFDYILENEKYIYFHFHTGFYTKSRQAFCGLYYKADHKVVLMHGDKLLDTVNSQSFRIRGVSSDGCFVALLQPDELCDEVKKKTDCKEEDNPVVVILE